VCGSGALHAAITVIAACALCSAANNVIAACRAPLQIFAGL
jgi:hypothetical protein